MTILLSDEEIEAMQGNSYFLNNLYILGIRRYMDYRTAIVGIKRRISYQSLSEEMFIESRKGQLRKDSGSPHKSAIRRALDQLCKIGLLQKIKNKDNLIFKLPLAKQGKSVQNKPDTNPTHIPDTITDTLQLETNSDDMRAASDFFHELDTIPDTPESTIPDTPQMSVKDKEKELLRSSKKKVKTQMSTDFKVSEHHETIARQNDWPDPHHEIDAFRDYHLARATKFADWDRAFYTWLRNAKKFKERTGGNYQSQARSTNSVSRAVDNILRSRNKHPKRIP